MTAFAPGNLPGVRHLRPRTTPGYRTPATKFTRCEKCKRNEYHLILKKTHRGIKAEREEIVNLRCMYCGTEHVETD